LRRRRIENRLRNVLFLSSRERMVHMLLELIDSYGDRQGNVCTVRLPLTHQDLASLIGVTRETVTVVLGQLQYDRLLKVQRRHITVLDCKRLAQECGQAAKSFSERGPHLEAIPKYREL
jgi:CRP-like cAMP-binding protein